MSPQKFARTVRRLEGFARSNPGLYRVVVALLAALGYLYIFLVLAVLIGLIVAIVLLFKSGQANAVGIRIIIALGVLVLAILQSLWVVFDEPRGTELNPREAPALFGMLRGLASTLKAPMPDHVLVVDMLNAGILQVPRLGIFGWQRNYLILGLPLMRAISTEHLRAVLAHEFGHLSVNHSRFAGWIYRLRQTWAQLLTALVGSGHRGAYLFLWFFRWYAPYFGAFTFALARLDEYDADRAAAEVVGRQTAGEALIALLAAAAIPPDQSLHTLPPEKRHAFLKWALSTETRFNDTHPALPDRLAALGYRPTRTAFGEIVYDSLPMPPPLQRSAADQLLGNIEGLVAHMRFQQQYGAR